MAVLSANIQEAQRRGDLNASAKLKQVYEQVVTVLRENMQPELRFINDLLSTESDEEASTLLMEAGRQLWAGAARHDGSRSRRCWRRAATARRCKS